ncbi:hypothetical protein [Herbaspirillum sp. SJZ107]|uniref:hypothetical protein n=1 Tax=Herbaspirillum sp. SJZ107 TaxID=2572881 RepID=UPI001154112C|nr:hypothetical protein [Herbaspirillum sp. SJZ107]TQK03427.1 hypothetical protein FBX97_4994 [Herbaspirillum sp. SJZ107]
MFRFAYFAALCAMTAFTKWSIADEITPRPERCPDQISYKSDTDPAYKYLEEQQHSIYRQNPSLTDPYSRAELEKPRSVNTFAELLARARKACPNPALRKQCALDPDLVVEMMKTLPCLALPTRFEAPLFISLINLYLKDLDKVRLKKFPRSPETRFGSLPTGTLDAQAILPPGIKNPVVILNRDLFFFTGAMSKAITDSIPITVGASVGLDYSKSAIRNRLHEHPYIVENFADAMVRLVREGSSAGAIEVTLDETHNHLHARLVTAMDQFLISHEEAHVILAHVSDQSVQFYMAGSHKNDKPATAQARGDRSTHVLPLAPNTQAEDPSAILKAQLRTRKQELEADALGFKLMIWSAEQEDDPIKIMVAAAAPHMTFRILDAANAYGTEAGGWKFSDVNHPTAADRIKALAPVFAEVAKTDLQLQEADFRDAFDAAFTVLLAEADPQIRKRLGLALKKR